MSITIPNILVPIRITSMSVTIFYFSEKCSNRITELNNEVLKTSLCTKSFLNTIIVVVQDRALEIFI